MSKLAKHHEEVGKTYDTSGLVTYGFDYEATRLDRDVVEYAITARYLDRYIPDGATVADVGVGVGHYSELLARRGCALHLVDVAQRLLDTTVDRLRGAGLADCIASVHHASATEMSGLPDGCCDAVLLLGPLYHLGDTGERNRAINEAARILRPGGLVFAAGINRITYLWDLLHDAPDSVADRAAFFASYLQDGNFDPPIEGYPPVVHLATAAEFQGELNTAFEQLVMAGTESFAGKLEPQFLSASAESQAVWLDLVERTGTTAEGLGITDHFLYIGRVVKG
ncbi:MAG: Methyltransferase type 11 [Chloroflexi bacterium]|nr:Methyltransferase type 11 [Chloroflexota bacterium]